jgi:hypothetical protein
MTWLGRSRQIDCRSVRRRHSLVFIVLCVCCVRTCPANRLRSPEIRAISQLARRLYNARDDMGSGARPRHLNRDVTEHLSSCESDQGIPVR